MERADWYHAIVPTGLRPSREDERTPATKCTGEIPKKPSGSLSFCLIPCPPGCAKLTRSTVVNRYRSASLPTHDRMCCPENVFPVGLAAMMNSAALEGDEPALIHPK
jgi:hypothetical protein